MIYLDNSATTKMYGEIIDIVMTYGLNNFYNPSGLYCVANSVADEIKKCKQNILKNLSGFNNSKIIFTASGTESDNLAIFGTKITKKGIILTSEVEHSAVYNSIMQLKNKGYKVKFIKCDKYGVVDFEDFLSNLSSEVEFVSIMHVCNETGGVNDLQKLTTALKQVSPKAIFHSDGVQAVGKIAVDLKSLDVDLYSFSSHKFHGLKGVGALYVKKDVNISPIIFGGGQEGGIRSATENVSGIVSTDFALTNCLMNFKRPEIRNFITQIACFIRKIEPNAIINSDLVNGAPHILSVALPNIRGEVLLHMLEDCGIIIGTGSACSSHKGNKRIPKALDLSAKFDMGMIRISLSEFNDSNDIKNFNMAFEQQYNKLKGCIGK